MREPTYSQIEAACAAMWGDTHPDFYERDLMKAALMAAQTVDTNIYGELHYGWGTDGVFYQCNSVEAQRKLSEWHHNATARLPHIEKVFHQTRRFLGDAEYMIAALVPMLGEKARKVWKMWKDQGVVRQHTSWAIDPMSLPGEDVAQVHLDFEAAPKTLVHSIDSDVPKTDVRELVKSLGGIDVVS